VSSERRVLAISGGVGGAKLAWGLAALLDPAELLIVANTGDDFEHLGLQICPDIDTLMYTLAGVADPVRGWGLAGETWQCIEALGALGGADWFRLGDRDLATHLQRSALLRGGLTLSEATAHLAAALGVRHAIVPMSDAPVRTLVDTDGGSFAFQEYFVRERCEPVVRGVRFAHAAEALPAPALGHWLEAAPRPVAVICPSNPYLSVDPVLAVPGLRERLAALPVVAVSPIVGGRAIKGPAAKMMAELGLPVSALEVARHYRGLADAFVIDREDQAQAGAIRALGMRVLVTDTVMTDAGSKRRLAADVLGLLDTPGA
jgi:LPPG:FO 2-phospho-L-lactate transferase